VEVRGVGAFPANAGTAGAMTATEAIEMLANEYANRRFMEFS